MAPLPRPRPALIDDLIIEILVRLTPDDTACLARASLVCKDWRRLLAGRTFSIRYRKIHGGAPVLGFLYNNYSIRASRPLFIPTTQPSPFPLPASVISPAYCRTIDCRHGRVLLHHPGYHPSTFTVWDPITNEQRSFSPSPPKHAYVNLTTAGVLCASNGCNHIGCSSGHFLVVFLEITHREDWLPIAQTRLYSSETRKWTVSASIDFDTFTWTTKPSLLAGDTIFFLVISDRSPRILKYDLTRAVLSAISVPPSHQQENIILCTAEDGGLGVAAVQGCSLRLLSGQTDPDGITRLVQDRAIELDSMIPSSVGRALANFYVVGFAEGTGYIFGRVNNWIDCIFSVEQKSGRMRNICSGKFGPIFPFMCFYSCARLI